MKKKILRIVFIVYCFALFFILFLYIGRSGNQFRLKVFSREHFDYGVNIIPFKTIGIYLPRIFSSPIAFQNIFANILMFIPMGFLLPVLFKKINKIWKCFLVVFIIVFSVEVIQFLTFRGSFDVDDIILNVCGSIIGYLFIKIKIVRSMVLTDE